MAAEPAQIQTGNASCTASLTKKSFGLKPGHMPPKIQLKSGRNATTSYIQSALLKTENQQTNKLPTYFAQ